MSSTGTTVESRERGRSGSARARSSFEISRPNDVRANAIRDALLRAESEYREMPGLCLTLAQAARLWTLDRSTCELVLTNLIERRILKRAPNGTYVRR
jgi:hypothetical protein